MTEKTKMLKKKKKKRKKKRRKKIVRRKKFIKYKVRNRNREVNKTRYSKKGAKSMSYKRRARDNTNTGPNAKVRY